MTNIALNSKTILLLTTTLLGLGTASTANGHPQSVTPSRVSTDREVEVESKTRLHAVRVVARFTPDELVPRLDMNVRVSDIPAGASVALSLRGAPLRFDQLTLKRQADLEKRFGQDASVRYEEGLSLQMTELVTWIRSTSGGDRVGVVGMPFAPLDEGDSRSNRNYTGLVGSVDLFIPRAGSSRTALNALSRLADGREVIPADGDLVVRSGSDRGDRGDRGSREARQRVDSDQRVRPTGEGSRRGSGRRSVSISNRDSVDGGFSSDAGGDSPLAVLRGLDSQEALAYVIGAWGTSSPVWDLNGDGLVDGEDLTVVLGYYEDEDGTDIDDGTDGSDGNGGNDDDGSGGDIQELVPGSGFSGSTPLPSRVGSPSMSGYPAKAIARWTEFPYITRSEDFYVTVSAYHMAGIDRVEFSLNGGDPVVCSEVQPHPDTGYAEYIVRVDVSDLVPGKHEIRATAFPEVGRPRVLQGVTPTDASIHTVNNGNESFWFNYDPNPLTVVVGAEAQYPTINDAIDALGSELYGGRIHLTAGDHVLLSRDSQSFRNTQEDMVLTISAAPGLQPGDVNLLGYLPSSSRSGRLTYGSLHIKDVTVITPRIEGYASAIQGRGANRLFVEGVYTTSDDPLMGWADLSVQRFANAIGNWTLGCWSKDCTFVNMPKGINGVMLAKNNRFTRLSADAFGSGPGAVINCTLDMSDYGNAYHSQHCDIIQISMNDGTIPVIENRIFADIRSTNSSAQVGHFSSSAGVPYENFAVINWEVDSMYGSSSLNLFTSIDHLVIDGCTFRNSNVSFSGGHTLKRVAIRNTLMRKFAANGAGLEDVFGGASRDIVFEGLHFYDARVMPFEHDGVSIGPVRFAAPSAPVGQSSDGTDGYIPSLVRVESQIVNQYLGNPNVLKQGVIRDHFYYDVDDLDLSWTILD